MELGVIDWPEELDRESNLVRRQMLRGGVVVFVSFRLICCTRL